MTQMTESRATNFNSDEGTEDLEEVERALIPSKPEEDPAPFAAQGKSLKDVLVQGVIVLLFCGFGAGIPLLVKLSEGPDGKLPYSQGAAVALAEITKLLISIVWIATWNRDDMLWPPPRAWLSESLWLSGVACLFALQNQLNYIITPLTGAAIFLLLGNLKIVWTCVFMRVLMNKSFESLQWFAVALLTLSSGTTELPTIVGNTEVGSGLVTGLVLLFIATTASGLAAVWNELILKRKGAQENGFEVKEMPFMLKNAVLYVWGVALNMGTWWYTSSSKPFFSGFNVAGTCSVMAFVGMGLTCACVLKYLDNIVRCFASVATVYVGLVLSRFLPKDLWEDPFSAWHTASLVLLSVALVVYSSHSSPSLAKQVVVSIVAAVVVGIMCMYLDQFLQRDRVATTLL